MPQIFKNNVSGVLSTQLSAIATSMVLIDASNFPAPGADHYFVTLIGVDGNGRETSWEIVRVTNKVSNTLTIVRAQEGTVAAIWVSGTTVQLRLTAGFATDLLAAIAELDLEKQPAGNYATGGGTATGTNTGDETGAGIRTKLGITTLSGSNTGDQTITLTGDVTGSGTGSFAATIQTGAVTLAKQANMATASVVYRKTAGSGAPEVQTLATLKTDLGLTGTNSGDQTSIVGITGTLAQFNTAVTDADLVSLAGAETLTNKTLTGYTETVYNLAGTDISVANGTIQTKTLSGATTLTESLADGQSVMLGITAGAHSVTWPTTVWAKVGGSGTAPTLTSTGVNWIILWQTGGTLRGAFLGTT